VYQPGDAVIQEGATDEKLYIIQRGVASVTSHELELRGHEGASLEVGDYFGELCLTGKRHKRGATVRAKTPLSVVSLAVSSCLANPDLAEWVRRLDALAGAAAAAKDPRAKDRRSERKSGTSGGAASSAAAPAGLPPSIASRSQNSVQRRSFAELMVDARKASELASERAAKATQQAAERSARNGANSARSKGMFKGGSAPIPMMVAKGKKAKAPPAPIREDSASRRRRASLANIATNMSNMPSMMPTQANNLVKAFRNSIRRRSSFSLEGFPKSGSDSVRSSGRRPSDPVSEPNGVTSEAESAWESDYSADLVREPVQERSLLSA